MEQRNMLLAFALSMLVLVGWQTLFPPQSSQQQPPAEAAKQAKAPAPKVQPPAAKEGATASAAKGAGAAAVASAPSKELMDEAQDRAVIARVSNDVLELSVNAKGSLIAAKLKKYRNAAKDGGGLVEVLHLDHQNAQYLNSGIMGENSPVRFRVVKASPSRVTLEAELAGGRVWQRTLTLKPGNYALSVDDRIKRGAGSKLYLQAVERNPNKKLNTFYEHAGPIGLLGGKLEEPDYDDLDEKGAVQRSATGGWTGIMSRYFLTAIYGDQKDDYHYFYKGDGRAYQAGVILDGKRDGNDALFHTTVFIGPKSIKLLKTYGVGLERSVDFGLFAFIAKPMHSFMMWLYGWVHNFGICIILLVVLIKALFYLPSKKSYASMAAMRKIQPEMKKMQERYADDRQKLGEEMMKLYKKHKVNPLSGCLPIVIQIPVFFALYKVLLMSIEMRQAPFFGWIQDLSVNDPWFILPVLMGASMFVQMKLNPQPPDPMQAKVMQFLPIVFTVMFLFFPAGLVLYWLVNNVLSIAQQRLVMKQVGVR